MNDKTETKAPAMIESMEQTFEQMEKRSIARVVPIDESRVDLFNPKRWTTGDIEVIKKTVCPAGIPDAEFKLFILKCQASGMNPLLGEAFCIKRNQNIGTKDAPKWIEVFAFTPGEQGMEGRADDFSDYHGLRAAAVYANDKIVIDASTGEVSHQYNPVDPNRGRLLGAWCIVYREGRKTPVEFVRLEEYIDLRNPKWNSSPATMIVKCARAAGLRRAYPNAFDGVFVREELSEDGERVTSSEQTTGSQVEQANRDTTDKLAERMKSTAKAQEELKAPAKPQSAKVATVEVVATKPKPDVVTTSQPTDDRTIVEAKRIIDQCNVLKLPYDGQKLLEDKAYREAMAARVAQLAQREAGAIGEGSIEGAAARAGPAPVEDQGPLMNFGPYKPKPIKSLEHAQLLEMVEYGNGKLGDLDDRRKAKVLATIVEIRKEIEARERALLDADEKAPPAREPGDDDID